MPKNKRFTSALIIAALIVAALFFGRAASADDDSALALQYYNRAVELHLAGHFSEAIAFYKKAIVLDPEAAAYHADLGEAYRISNMFREAIIELETAIQLDPTLVNAYTTLGVIMDREDLPQRAVEYHRQALKLDPNSYVAYNNLGHAYHSLGLIRAAIANYRKSIELRPDFAPAYDNLGTDLMILNQPDEAADVLEKAIQYAGKDHPQLGLYYNDLGAAYVAQGKLQDAYDALQQAVTLMPNNSDIRLNFEFVKEKINGKSN